jgi:hypothetical protein
MNPGLHEISFIHVVLILFAENWVKPSKLTSHWNAIEIMHATSVQN